LETETTYDINNSVSQDNEEPQNQKQDYTNLDVPKNQKQDNSQNELSEFQKLALEKQQRIRKLTESKPETGKQTTDQNKNEIRKITVSNPNNQTKQTNDNETNNNGNRKITVSNPKQNNEQPPQPIFTLNESTTEVDVDELIDEETRREQELYIEKRKTQIKNFNFNEYLENERLKGFLKKRDLSIFKMWPRKWFTLQESKLLYYPQPQSNLGKKEAPEGIISVLQAIDIEVDGTKRFIIKLPEMEYHLEANTTEERDHWITGLKESQEISRTLEQYTFQGDNSQFSLSKEEIRKEGALFRKGYTGWTKVKIIVMDGMLYSYSIKSGNRKDKIALFGSKWEEDTGGEYAWSIEAQNGTKIYLAATSEMEMHQWLNFLKKQTILIEETINSITFD